MSDTTTPESPPAAPVVPVGLATNLGIAGTVVLALATALAGVLPGDARAGHYATLAVVVAVATIIGRMLQAAAAMLGAKVQPAAGATTDDTVDKDEPVLTDEDLAGAHRDDPLAHSANESAAYEAHRGQITDDLIEGNNRA